MAHAAAGEPPPPGPRPLPVFKLERYFAAHEFSTPHLLCCSDSQPLSVADVLALASPEDLALWAGLRLGYTETQGLPALRAAVAARYGPPVGPEGVVLAAPQEALYLAMLALLRPGDHVVVQFPGYASLYEVARAQGCEVSLWEVSPAPGGAGGAGLSFDVAALRGLLRPGATRLVVTNFPHNPTGLLPSAVEWLEVVGACKAAGAYLFSDEMYRGLEFDPCAALPSAAELYPRAISLSGVSKALGLPGLRIGWLATQDEAVVRRVLELKDYTTICSSAPSEVLALIAVKAWDAIAARHLDLLRTNLGLLRPFFRRWAAVLAWQEPRAGTVAFPRLLPGAAGAAADSAEFCRRVAAEAGVLLLPAEVYDHQPSVDEGRFRLGFGRSDLGACLEALDAFLVREHGQPPPA